MQRGIRAFLGSSAANLAPTPQCDLRQSDSTPASTQQFSRKRKRPAEESPGDRAVAARSAPRQDYPLAAAPAAAEAPLATPPGKPPPGAGKAKQLTQMYLDVGQREFHATRCTTCGMLYTPGDPTDERLHAAFHSAATKGLRYAAAAGDEVLAQDGARGKLVLVKPAHAAANSKRLLEIAAFLEDQMGLIKGWLLGVPCTVTVYVSARRILGCLVVESIKGAFQAAPRPPAQPPQLLSCTSGGAAPSPWDKAGGCQTAADAAPGSAAGGPEPAAEGAPAPRRADGGISIDRSRQVKAMCGVRVMWTSVEARRQGLATKLLDCARAQVICGYVVPRAAVAFTQPTADGHAFIQRYTGASQFLVY